MKDIQTLILKPIIPPKRRRNCYRIDKDQMNIEITRGRSEIYDILTHLTFLFIESHKIKERVSLNDGEDFIREWKHLEDVVFIKRIIRQRKRSIHCTFRQYFRKNFDEVSDIYKVFATEENPDKFFQLFIG